MHMRVHPFACLALLLLVLAGCGSDSSLGSSTRQVDDVDISASQIRIGEATGTDIFFETETDFSGKPANVDIVVRISPGLEFVDRSSFIYDNTEDDHDARGPNFVSLCDNGTTFLVFNLATEDLDEHSLNGGTQYGMHLSVAGKERTNHATVSATAGSDQEFSCNDFPVEESDQVEVR